MKAIRKMRTPLAKSLILTVSLVLTMITEPSFHFEKVFIVKLRTDCDGLRRIHTNLN